MKNIQHSNHESSWTASTFKTPSEYTFNLSEKDKIELLSSIREIPSHIKPEEIKLTNLNLGNLSKKLNNISKDVENGKGFVIIRGIPTHDNVTLQEYIMATWLVGLHFGNPLSQNTSGDLIGHVVDASAEDPTPRMYRSNLELRPHNDITAMISLSCWHKSQTGGASVVVNAISVHDQLKELRPDLMDIYYNGFHYHLVGEEAPGCAPVTTQRVPVFAICNGQLSSRYLRSNIVAGHKSLGIPLTEREIEAMNLFDQIATKPENRLAFFLERGDMIVMNNYTIMHARTSFSNFPEPERKRHLVRLWLDKENFRCIPDSYYFHGVNGVPRQEGKGATLNFKQLYADDPVASGGIADLQVTDEMARSGTA